MFNKTAFAKKAVSLVVGYGVTEIVRGVVDANTSPQRLVTRVAVIAARIAIAGIVSQQVQKYTDSRIDALVEGFNKTVSEANQLLADEAETIS